MAETRRVIDIKEYRESPTTEVPSEFNIGSSGDHIKALRKERLLDYLLDLGDKASDNLATLMLSLKGFGGYELLTTTLDQDIEINFVPIETEPRITQEQHQQGLDRLNYLKQLKAVESNDLVLELEE